MKLLRKYLIHVLICLPGLFHSISQAQQSDEDHSLIYILCPNKFSSFTSNFKMYFNKQLIDTFEMGTRLEYKIYSEGKINVFVSYKVFGKFETGQGKNIFSFEVRNGEVHYFKFSGSELFWLSNSEGKELLDSDSDFSYKLKKIEEDKTSPIFPLKFPLKQEETKPPVKEEVVMRGSGDPLKGLNVSKAKEMVIGDYYALIIGIDNYTGSWTPLNNAVNDAKSIAHALGSNYKFDNLKTLYNTQATRKSIINELEWLIHHTKEKDNVFIYYSGHGQFKEELNKGYWVPVDATTNSTSDYISNSDIQTYLGGIKAKHTLLISDACFSGDIFRGSTISVPFENTDKYFMTVHNLTSRQAMTSGGIEPVMDGGRDGHSVFAYYLLKTLTSNDAKYYDASQLFETLRIPVINNSEQAPKFSAIKNTGDEGGQFIFIRK